MIRVALCQACHPLPETSAALLIGGTQKPILICDSKCGTDRSSKCERLVLTKFVPGKDFLVCCD